MVINKWISKKEYMILDVSVIGKMIDDVLVSKYNNYIGCTIYKDKEFTVSLQFDITPDIIKNVNDSLYLFYIDSLGSVYVDRDDADYIRKLFPSLICRDCTNYCMSIYDNNRDLVTENNREKMMNYNGTIIAHIEDLPLKECLPELFMEEYIYEIEDVLEIGDILPIYVDPLRKGFVSTSEFYKYPFVYAEGTEKLTSKKEIYKSSNNTNLIKIVREEIN